MSQPQVKFNPETHEFAFVGTYHDREIPRSAGFRWDSSRKLWVTKDAWRAAKLSKFATESAKHAFAEAEAIKAASKTVDADIDIPAPAGESYLPYQRGGIAFMLKHRRVLNGDEMGLGKTIQVLGTINADASIKKVLIVAPKTLLPNWREEAKKWLVRPMKIAVTTPKKCDAGAECLVTSYEHLQKHLATIQGQEWDLVAFDESHMVKNGKAKRTQAALAVAKQVSSDKYLFFLNGTPILNRPIELWTTLNTLDLTVWKSRGYFAKRFCAGHQGAWGWDESGASNLDELQDIMRSNGHMIRRLKKDVLTELPAKRRQIIPVAVPKGAARILKEEAKAFEKLVEANGYDAAASKLMSRTAAFEDIAELRHLLAVAKVPAVAEHVQGLLESTNKVVVMAHHKDVVDALMEKLEKFNPVKVTGSVSGEARQAAVESFQKDPDCRVFVGNIAAAGVGITLTASSTVVFAELSFVPGEVTQAEDRCHRIGQTNAVLVHHLVVDKSLDARMVEILIEKQKVADAALDGDTSSKVAAAIESAEEKRKVEEDKKAKIVRRKDIEKEGQAMHPRQGKAIHECLILLADSDEDRATEANGVGFNRFDNQVGHSLARTGQLSPAQAVLGRKLISKYHKQLPAGLYAEAMGSAEKEASNGCC